MTPRTANASGNSIGRSVNGVNVAQPLVLSEDRVFISTSYDVAAGAMVKVTLEDGKWQAKQAVEEQ